MTDGILGRWSKRKLAVREGKELPDLAPPTTASIPAPAPSGGAGAALAGSAATAHLPATSANLAATPVTATAPELAKPEAPPLTLDDVRALTGESDFSAFVRPGVSPEVKNAAMKKLFTNPHFNVMDRLDTYIDDYSQSDPLPLATLRKLASAKFLGMFDDEEKEAEGKQDQANLRDGADTPAGVSVAQSEPLPTTPVPDPGAATDPLHANPDLRLQPDHATPGKSPGHGAQ